MFKWLLERFVYVCDTIIEGCIAYEGTSSFYDDDDIFDPPEWDTLVPD